MELKLHNTLTRKKELFTPLDSKNVRMYVCGPTVYDFAHIGNARPVIVFDVLFRLLRHLAKQGVWDGGKGETKVTYARNITDVDDKINARAAEEYPGMPLNAAIAKVTSETTKQFHEDISALGVLEPTVEPACTDHIKQMTAMIDVLESKGYAYNADGHMLLDTSQIHDYGRLSGRSLDEMIAGARVEVAPYKRNPADSVLWKPSTDEQPGWDSPWGRGRPGWHIECSAMAREYLGDVFDIHGGGIDLTFPHHENELAQSTCAHDTKQMAQVWMHNGYLQVEGRKMSKSEGNFVTINELLEDWGGSVLRLSMLKTHYRQPIDWTKSSLSESGRELTRWIEFLEPVEYANNESPDEVVSALLNDLNSVEAITALRTYFKEKEASKLALGMTFLGLSLDKEDIQGGKHKRLYAETGVFEFSGSEVNLTASTDPDRAHVDELITARNAARAAKNWAEADRLRDELDAMGVVLKDGPEGTTWEIKQ